MINAASPDYLQARTAHPARWKTCAQHRVVHYAQTLSSKSEGWEIPGRRRRPLQDALPVRAALTVNGAEAYEAACAGRAGLDPGAGRGAGGDYLASGRAGAR
jgi:hypothetical protein